MINIPSTNDDPAYRYKMPRLISKKEGRGNGSRTCIVNMGDVARALKRPPQYTTKWFGTELGAMSTYTNKESQGERCIINGHHDTHVFQTSLDNFINKYVCCENCKLPEIEMAVKKGVIVGRCLACGWGGSMDNNHRVAVFIAKNPPDSSGHNIISPGDENAGKKDKKARRAEKLARAQRGDEEEGGEEEGSEDESKEAKKDKKKDKKKKDKKSKGSDSEDSGDEEVKEKKKKKKKEKKAKDSDNEDSEEEVKEKKKKKEKKAKGSDSDEEGEEKEKKKKKDKKDKKAKKEKKDKKEKKEKKKKESESDSEQSSAEAKPARKGKKKDDEDDVQDLEYDDEEIQSVVKVLKEFTQSKGGKPTVDDFFEELRMHQLAKCFDHKVRLFVVLQALCDNTMDAKSMALQKRYIKRAITNAGMSTAEICWVLGAYYKVNPANLKGFSMVLKCAFDEDWLTEDDLLAYYNDDQGAGEPGFEDAKKNAAPFLKWLATAGSDEDSDEDDDDDSD